MYNIGERWIAVSTIGPTPVVSTSEDDTCGTWPPDVAVVPVAATVVPAEAARGVAEVTRS